MHKFTPIFMAGVVTGIAVTVLYQNVTGMQAGGVLVNRETTPVIAKSPVVVPAPEVSASPVMPIKLATVPELPVLPVAAAPIRGTDPEMPTSLVNISGRSAGSDRYPKNLDDDGTGVHVEIRGNSKQSTSLPASDAPLNAAEKTLRKMDVATREFDTPKTPNERRSEYSLIREQADGVFVRSGNQVRFVPNEEKTGTTATMRDQ